MEKLTKVNLEQKQFCQEIGIAVQTLIRAINYIKDKQADPDAVEVKN